MTDVFVDHSSIDEEPAEFLNMTKLMDRLIVDGETIPFTDELVAARERVEDAGLRLTGI